MKKTLLSAGTKTVSKCLICSGGVVSAVHNYAGLQVLHCQACNFDWVEENIEPQFGLSKVESSTTPGEVVEGYLKNIDADIQIAKRSMNLRIPVLEAAFGGKFNSVCEVGCSIGNGFYPFRDRCIDWIGLETDPRYIDYGKRKQIPIIDIDLADLEQTFDLIYFHQVLEHIWDPVAFMKIVFERLNPGGIVHVAVPNHVGFTAITRKAFPRLFPTEYGMIQFPHHLRAYSPRALNKLFSFSGFQPIEARGILDTDDCWGEWFPNKNNFLSRLIFTVGASIGLGTLLFGYAKKPVSIILE